MVEQNQEQNLDPKVAEGEGEKKSSPQSFTQADVDRIVAERIQRERAKYSDYEDLKAKAGEAKTAEERIAELEGKYQAAEVARLRSDVAARHGVSAEDRDLFLTGSDEATLTAQAQRLAERYSGLRNNGNVVPREGNNPRPAEDEMRTFARNLFADKG